MMRVRTSPVGKTALVTGASSGIGAATVEQLSADGWTVFAAARRADKLAALAAATGCIPVACDVTSQDDVDAVVQQLQEHGSLNALVNNAGLAVGTDAVEDADFAGWETMWQTNVVGTVRVTRALLPLLRQTADAQGTNVDILTVTSTAGHTAYEGGGGYTATKHGTTDIVETLRLELCGEPIRVTEIAPGMVHTEEFSLKRLHGDQAAADAVYQDVQEPLTADDVAHVIVSTLEMPPQINLDLVVVRPVAQAAQHKVHRGPLAAKLA